MKTQTIKSILAAAAAITIVCLPQAEAITITFNTESAFTNNITQTYDTAPITWDASGYIKAPTNIAAALYSTGGSNAYASPVSLYDAVSITFSFDSLTGRSMVLYSRVDSTTKAGIAGYFGLVDNQSGGQIRFRLYNSGTPEDGGLGSLVSGADSIITLTNPAITTNDHLTFTMLTSQTNSDKITLSIARDGETLETWTRSLTNSVTNNGSIGFRSFNTTKIYELSAVPEPTVAWLAAGGLSLLSLMIFRRKKSRN